MAFQLGDDDAGGISEINLVPLIDIMLVLMIIFLVTATVLNPSVPLKLPSTSASVSERPPTSLQVSINADGSVFKDDKPLSLAELDSTFSELSHATDKPTIILRADKDARYDTIAKVLAMASQADLTDIAFENTSAD